MAEDRELPGWPKKKLVTTTKRWLANFGIRPQARLWYETWMWANQVAQSYYRTLWPTPSEIAAQYVLLLMVEMQSQGALKLPYRAAQQQPPRIKQKLLAGKPQQLTTYDEEGEA